ncbi:G1/S-specific cyclin-E1 [Clarias magur]|uniref:G1/S-specific cyclin-E1 n=1 Tax=Clarias magur TaxID=1594786 RepID=A0A8J4U7Q1_CLAMG|nr:G1/S-specific cyclin-E1 [Clarias magur]
MVENSERRGRLQPCGLLSPPMSGGETDSAPCSVTRYGPGDVFYQPSIDLYVLR